MSFTKPDLKKYAVENNATVYYCHNCAMQHLTAFCDKIGTNCGYLGPNWTAWRLPDGNVLVYGDRVPNTIGQYIDYDTAKLIDRDIVENTLRKHFSFYKQTEEVINCYNRYYSKMIEGCIK